MYKNITKNKLDVELQKVYDNINHCNYKRLIFEFLEKIFKYNNFKISVTTLKHYLKGFDDFIYFNIDDDIINSVDDLKFYILNELNLQMANNEYLYNRFLLNGENNNIYKKFNGNFMFVEIE